MAKVVVLGAGVAGQTAALILRRGLTKDHEVIVVSPNSKWNWIPSNIWVGVGLMEEADVTFELRPVYEKQGITFHQAKAIEMHPAGDSANSTPYVTIEYTDPTKKGEIGKVEYDFVVNATGPKLNFAATPGLGPEGNSLSVCTFGHAAQTAKELMKSVARMKKGEELTFVIGTGHGAATCEGAAFEYMFNLEFELRRHGVRDKARLIYLTNESELGDFGVGGLHFERGGYIMQSKTFAESLFAERNVESITGAHVSRVDPNLVSFETLDGQQQTLAFDFAMLIPPFTGSGMKAFDASGTDITPQLFAPNGFMKVDANYTAKTFEDWSPDDWPKTYQSPAYSNVFAVGIAFAPPHQISQPRTSVNGTNITPAPPRTGMPSAIMARTVAQSILEIINKGAKSPIYTASLAEMGAACVASAGSNWLTGTAASITMYPIVPNYDKFPEVGRDLNYTFGDIGTAGHWIKQLLHYMFMYKAKARPFWWIIPE
jgi:sulfide:quinone oxidoreductase